MPDKCDTSLRGWVKMFTAEHGLGYEMGEALREVYKDYHKRDAPDDMDITIIEWDDLITTELKSSYNACPIHVEDCKTVYIQLQSCEIDNMMAGMQYAYSDMFTKYNVSNIELGDLCAIRTNSIWYRGRVVDRVPCLSNKGFITKQLPSCKIHLIDFGNSINFKCRNVYYLFDKFRNINPLVYCCSLSNLRPLYGYKWSEESTSVLKELVEGRFFSMFISEITSSGRYSIQLINKLSLKIINKKLAAKKLVRYVATDIENKREYGSKRISTPITLVNENGTDIRPLMSLETTSAPLPPIVNNEYKKKRYIQIQVPGRSDSPFSFNKEQQSSKRATSSSVEIEKIKKMVFEIEVRETEPIKYEMQTLMNIGNTMLNCKVHDSIIPRLKELDIYTENDVEEPYKIEDKKSFINACDTIDATFESQKRPQINEDSTAYIPMRRRSDNNRDYVRTVRDDNTIRTPALERERAMSYKSMTASVNAVAKNRLTRDRSQLTSRQLSAYDNYAAMRRMEKGGDGDLMDDEADRKDISVNCDRGDPIVKVQDVKIAKEKEETVKYVAESLPDQQA